MVSTSSAGRKSVRRLYCRRESISGAETVMRMCHQCQKELTLEEPIGRRDTCPGCGADVRCCLNCAFYDEHSADACREPNAELVQHKDTANFCDFFALKSEPVKPTSQSSQVGGDARSQLDALFKKKSS